MGTTRAWNEAGEVTKHFGTPWGGMRKAFLLYKNATKAISKLTLEDNLGGKEVFDFEKQATEGMVVVGVGYKSVAFFLPDDKEMATEEMGSRMTINNYLRYLGSTHADIPAWNDFALYLLALMYENMAPHTLVPFTITRTDGGETLSGEAEFNTCDTAAAFFDILGDRSSESTGTLSDWFSSDMPSVEFKFSVTLGDQSLSFDMCVGRK